MANTDDIRYQATERALRAAYLELAKDADVDRITATRLCKTARISRNAFYLHYSNVSELYTTMVDEVVSDLRARCLESANKVISSKSLDTTLTSTIISVLSSHEELIRSILPADNGSLSAQLAEGITSSYIDAALVFGKHGASMEHRISCAFAAWGLIGLIREWISDTTRPISEALPYFESLQRGISSNATEFLLQK